MKIQLSDHFTYHRLMRFVIPSILLMLGTSLYSIVDGLFVSNYVGKIPFAAINLIMPIAMAGAAFGFMIGTGGSAIVSKTLGEGKRADANAYFSMLIYVTIIGGLILSALGMTFIRPLSMALGAEGEMLENCVIYGRILFSTATAFMLQSVFQSFFVVAEKPTLSLIISIAAGLTNVVLDYLFIAVFQWGIAGAAIATAAGEIIGGILPLVYFSRKNNSLLQLQKTKFNKTVLFNTCVNGSSEMVTSLSASVVNMLYNFQLMRLAGEDGIAAFGVIMYANFIFSAIFLGYSIGSAPIVSYHYGAGNHSELKNIFKKSLFLIGITGITLTVVSHLIAAPLIQIFVGYDPDLAAMTTHGFMIYAFMFLLCGFNIWGSSFFTALNNGGISALISFSRTLIFEISAVLILPIFLDIDGIWLSVVVAETLALFVTTICLVRKHKVYQYA
ncbi:MAG: MATE family efflux transporter [Peptococcaceae bacterium]|nr:MATE family efflux transporter [Peptococcaceae bacterium]